MSGVSYIQAGVSCLPLVGPFVGFYTNWKLKNEMESGVALESLSLSATGMMRGLSAFAGNEKGVEEAQRSLDEQNALLRNKYLGGSQRGRIYAICGIVGNVLSVALLVGLTALRILSVQVGLIWCFAFTLQAIVLSLNLRNHNKQITQLNSPSI